MHEQNKGREDNVETAEGTIVVFCNTRFSFNVREHTAEEVKPAKASSHHKYFYRMAELYRSWYISDDE